MGAVFEFLGLTVGCLPENAMPADRLQLAGTDIVYVTGPAIAWTYLWDNHHMKLPQDVVRTASAARAV